MAGHLEEHIKDAITPSKTGAPMSGLRKVSPVCD
jgi:hypothetical protein